MAKKPVIQNITSGYTSNSVLNNNFDAIRDAFDNTLSRDGSTPNVMNADFDMNGYDIINVGNIDIQGYSIRDLTVNFMYGDVVYTDDIYVTNIYDRETGDPIIITPPEPVTPMVSFKVPIDNATTGLKFAYIVHNLGYAPKKEDISLTILVDDILFYEENTNLPYWAVGEVDETQIQIVYEIFGTGTLNTLSFGVKVG